MYDSHYLKISNIFSDNMIIQAYLEITQVTI